MTNQRLQKLILIAAYVLIVFGLLAGQVSLVSFKPQDIFAADNVPVTPPTPPSPSSSSPRITTLWLIPGRLNSNYQTEVSGRDKDINDNLTMTISGLPKGLSQGSCKQTINFMGKNIRCQIIGKLQVRGIFNVNIKLTDSVATVTKELKLFIW